MLAWPWPVRVRERRERSRSLASILPAAEHGRLSSCLNSSQVWWRSSFSNVLERSKGSALIKKMVVF
jgi:hypothetical protein